MEKADTAVHSQGVASTDATSIGLCSGELTHAGSSGQHCYAHKDQSGARARYHTIFPVRFGGSKTQVVKPGRFCAKARFAVHWNYERKHDNAHFMTRCALNITACAPAFPKAFVPQLSRHIPWHCIIQACMPNHWMSWQSARVLAEYWPLQKRQGKLHQQPQ